MYLLGGGSTRSRVTTVLSAGTRVQAQIKKRKNCHRVVCAVLRCRRLIHKLQTQKTTTYKRKKEQADLYFSMCLSAVGGSVAFGATLQSDARWLRCGKLVQQGFGGIKVVKSADLRIIVEVVWRAFRLIARVEAVNVEAVM